MSCARLQASKEWLQAWQAKRQQPPPATECSGNDPKGGTGYSAMTSASADTKAVSAELANQIVDRALSADGRDLLDIINACCDVDHLDEAARLLWKGVGEGAISDGESTVLANAIERRRPLGRRTAPGHATQVGRI